MSHWLFAWRDCVLFTAAGMLLIPIGAIAAPGQRGERAGEPVATLGKVATSSPIPAATTAAPEPLIAVVSIADQTVAVYNSRGRIMQSRVSSGKPGHDTPTGVFSILQRNRHHESNLYSNAPMPYMQRLTWSGIALHAGVVPGYPASHGCIRLPASFAPKLWAMGQIGMRVIVSPVATAPRAFAHPALPSPQPATGDERLAGVQLTSASAGAAPPPLLGYRLAQLRHTQATAEKVRSDAAVKPAFAAAAARSTEAQQLASAVKASANVLADAMEYRDLIQASFANVQTEAAEAVVMERLRDAEGAVQTALDAHEALQSRERLVDAAAFTAARVARETELQADEATQNLKLARRALEPVSVFISRRTGQLYVRQGFHELYEGQVDIRDADRPLGTHVYTVAELAADNRAQWLAVSVPTRGGDAGRARRNDAATERPSDAAEALDRVAIPAEARALIEERLFPGGSIIVSDYGLGETGQGTDFVILTK